MRLILVGGSIANGKTTLSTALSRDLGVPRVAMDDLKESLFNLYGSRDRDWSRRLGEATFPLFRRVIEVHLERGDSVIAEATFLYPEDAEWAESVAAKHGAELVLVWLTCDPRVSRERFIRRAQGGYHPGHRHATEEVLAEFDERYFSKTFISPVMRARTLVVDTTDFQVVSRADIAAFCLSA
jgi:glucokinase